MKARLLILSIAVLCLSAAPAMAALFGPDGGSGLQTVLDDITKDPVTHLDSGDPGASIYDSTVKVANNVEVPDSLDSVWHTTGSGAGANTMIIELASFAGSNSFGVYDITNPSNTVEIFGGGNIYGDQAFLSIDTDGNVSVNTLYKKTFGGSGLFGYYLDATLGDGLDHDGDNDVDADDGKLAGGGYIWYSDSSLNISDGMDHMYAYQGTGDWIEIPKSTPGSWAGPWSDDEYILAWEDLYGPLPYASPWVPGVSSDGDFTDFVVLVESVYPVPVPAAVLLGVLGLGVAGWKLRKYA